MLTSENKTALLDSGDCWNHNNMFNPWHCMATAENWWQITGGRPDTSVLVALAGYDEFPETHPFLDIIAAKRVFRYHDDDHVFRESLANGQEATVTLQGVFRHAILNAPPSSSVIWSAHKEARLRGMHGAMQLRPEHTGYVLVLTRRPVGERGGCTRCVDNVGSIVDHLRSHGLEVVLSHFTALDPVPRKQISLVMGARLVVAPHGGHWGLAALLSPEQSAIELCLEGSVTAEHFVAHTGAKYLRVECQRGTTAVSMECDAAHVAKLSRDYL